MGQRIAWAFLVVPAAVGCGGVDLGAYRHVDGPGAPEAGTSPLSHDAGSSAPGNFGDASSTAADAGLRCGSTDAIVDWSSPLSCDGLDGCAVSDVKLAVTGGQVEAFGVASSTDGTQRGLWTRTLDDGGAVLQTGLVTSTDTPFGNMGKLDTVAVNRNTPIGIALGLSASDGVSRAMWLAPADAPSTNTGGGTVGRDNGPLESFIAVSAHGEWLAGGVTDANGNFYWGQILSGSGGTDVTGGLGGPILAADQQGSTAAFWYGTRTTDSSVGGGTAPAPTYPRSSDFVAKVDFATGERKWTMDLLVHSIVRMRANAAGDAVVAGVLESGALDVRVVSSEGTTPWVASPVVEGPVSLCVTDDAAGGAVVAWNVVPKDGSEAHVVLQHFDARGAWCGERQFPGTATDVIVRGDGHIVVATGDAILQIAP